MEVTVNKLTKILSNVEKLFSADEVKEFIDKIRENYNYKVSPIYYCFRASSLYTYMYKSSVSLLAYGHYVLRWMFGASLQGST
jgi:hypothetical protein